MAEGNASWRNIVVGDGNWRILFRIDEQNTVATVVVAIGDRGNDECYRIAQRRLAAPQGPAETVSLAGALAQLAAADEFRIIKAGFASALRPGFDRDFDRQN